MSRTISFKIAVCNEQCCSFPVDERARQAYTSGHRKLVAIGMPPLQKSGNRVLLAEDEPMVATVLAEMLADLGYQAMIASTGPEAIAAIRSAREFDAVITDVSMPGATGREVLAAVRDRYPSLPVLYVTGYDATEVHADVTRDAHLRVLQKPFGADGLRDALTGFIPQFAHREPNRLDLRRSVPNWLYDISTAQEISVQTSCVSARLKK